MPLRVTNRHKTVHDHSYVCSSDPLVNVIESSNENSPLSSPPRESGYTMKTMANEHNYDACNRADKDLIFSPKTGVKIMYEEMEILKKERDDLLAENIRLTKQLAVIPNADFRFENLGENDELFKLYTGIPSYAIFNWLYRQIEHKLSTLQYYRGNRSFSEKSYQVKLCRKPGPKRILDFKNEMLLTLMKVRLGLVEEDLAFRFNVSSSLVSSIFSTWVSLLGLELKSLIKMPTVAGIKNYYPDCFKKYGTVLSIIDCTEVYTQKPSLAEANSKCFSSYKFRTTAKVLVGCAPSGYVCFLSEAFSGAMSDKEIVQKSDFLKIVSAAADETSERLTIMADRGFNIQELLLPMGIKLEKPPQLTNKVQFAVKNNIKTKAVANARVHVERVIGRMKEFRILKYDIRADSFDVVTNIFRICGGLVNLQPPLVPL